MCGGISNMWKDLEDLGNGYVLYRDSDGLYGVYNKVKKGIDSIIVANRTSKKKAIRDSSEVLSYGEDFKDLVNSKKEYKRGFSLDPKIRELLLELNSEGYITSGSCEGHNGNRGFITFDKGLTREESKRVSEILKKYRANRITWKALNTQKDLVDIVKFYI